MDKYTLGLDIGTTKIVAMVGRENQYGKIEILGVGKSKSDGVSKGMVMNLVKTTQSIKLALAQAQSQVGREIPISEAIVGIAGNHIKSMEVEETITREHSDEIITNDDIDSLFNQIMRLYQSPEEQIIHILPQEYIIDDTPIDQLHDPIGMTGKRLKAIFQLVLGQTVSIGRIQRCVNDSELKIKELTLEPLASAASVLSEDEKEIGVALVDIGGGTTDLAIFKNGKIRYTAVIPLGGNIITADIQEGCEILQRDAERCKVQFGSACPEYNKENEGVTIRPYPGANTEKFISFKDLSLIINARLVEIINAVFNEILNYGHSDPKKKLSAGIVLTGGGSQMKHITQLVQFLTGMDTRIGFPNAHLASGTKEEFSSPIYATSVGLVMTGVDLQKKEEAKIVVQKKEEKQIFQNQEVKVEEPEIVKNEENISENEPKPKKFFNNAFNYLRKILDDK